MSTPIPPPLPSSQPPCLPTSQAPPITASFRWSKDEFLLSQRLAMRCSREGRWISRFNTAVGALILLSGIVTLYQHIIGWLGFLFTIVFGGFLLSMPFFARRAALKFYSQKPDRDMEVIWDISEDGVRSKTPLAVSENTWLFFPRVIRAREGFLLFPSARIFHWLPMHAFRNTEDAERFARLAKSKVRAYAEMG